MTPTRIILHCSATKDSGTVSWGAIRDYHTKLGWSDIGYHFGIENLRGQTEILIGRLPNRQGAHCSGHNSDSIGVCFVGDFDHYQVPQESWDAGVKLVKYLVQAFGIKEVLGHRELYSGKSCPGNNFDLGKFRGAVFSP